MQSPSQVSSQVRVEVSVVPTTTTEPGSIRPEGGQAALKYSTHNLSSVSLRLCRLPSVVIIRCRGEAVQINFNFQPPSSKLIMSGLCLRGAAPRSGGTPEIWTMRSVWKLSLVLEIYLEIVGWVFHASFGLRAPACFKIITGGAIPSWHAAWQNPPAVWS